MGLIKSVAELQKARAKESLRRIDREMPRAFALLGSIFVPRTYRDAGGVVQESIAPPDDWGAVGHRPWTRPPISNTQRNLARSHGRRGWKREKIPRQQNRVFGKVGRKVIEYHIAGAVRIGRHVIQPGRRALWGARAA